MRFLATRRDLLSPTVVAEVRACEEAVVGSAVSVVMFVRLITGVGFLASPRCEPLSSSLNARRDMLSSVESKRQGPVDRTSQAE